MNAVAQSVSSNPGYQIGSNMAGESVYWSPSLASNHNCLFIGESGSGKTFTISNTIARIYQENRPTVHIFDTKGDYTPESFHKSGLGRYVSEADFNVIDFNYVDGNGSVNLLQFAKSREGGGVFMAIQELLSLLKTVNPSFSTKMAGYTQVMMEELYRNFGIYHEDQSTWSRDVPNLADLLKHIEQVIHSLQSGVGESIFEKIGNTRKKIISATTALDKAAYGGGSTESHEKKIENETKNLHGLVNNLIDEVMGQEVRLEQSWKAKKLQFLKEQIEMEEQMEWARSKMIKEADLDEALIDTEKKQLHDTIVEMAHTIISPFDSYYSGWKVDSLLSIRDTVYTLVKSRLFTGTPSARRRGAINLYSLTGVSPVHQQLLMHVFMKQIYNMAVTETVATGNFDPLIANHIIVADEGKHAKEISKSPLSPLNRISSEGRGYGLGLYAGVQSCDQLTTDSLNNFGTYFITAPAKATYNDIKKNLGATQLELERLVPKSNCLFKSGGSFEIIRQYA